MNKIISTVLAAVITLSAAAAPIKSLSWPEQSFTNPSVERTPTSLVLTMDVNPGAFALKSNQQVWLRPAVVSDTDTLWFSPVVVAGRTRFLQNERTRALPADAIRLHADVTEPYSYQAIVPYLPWMDRCELVLTGTVSGCCGDGLGAMKPDQPLVACDFRDKTLHPAYIYVSPTKEIIKTRSARGEAYINYPVNVTRIIPDYRNNPTELAKIVGTIDHIKQDPDATLTSISFKGYASPEGSWTDNERLAKGRTESLIEYVGALYDFPRDAMHASWVAEDWQGLARRLRLLDLDNKDAILALVTDTVLAPDVRELRLKKDFPQQYAYLLSTVYPLLRRSDYNVVYTVRNYTDIDEIAAIMGSEPQKLSLDELYIYAKSLPTDSPEFREVMEVAVRMFPDDPEANLNAASTAIAHGDYDKAGAYLDKAGSSPAALYNRGLLEALRGNYAAAVPLLRQASDAGIADAEDLLATMRSFNLIK